MARHPLCKLGDESVRQALRGEGLAVEIGPFVSRLCMRDGQAIEFFLDMYRDVLVGHAFEEPADFSLQLRPPNVFRGYIKKQIVPDPGFHFPAVPLPNRLSPLALEMGMNLNVALQCFRFGIFHAGVVAWENRAIVMPAKSGGGKSTLTAALMENGFRLLSDEFAILDMSNSSLIGYPRPVSLKNKSIDVVGNFAGSENISMRLKDTPKGDIAYRRVRADDLRQANNAVKAGLILFPTFEAGCAPRATKMEPADAAMQLIASSTNYQVIGESAFLALMNLLENTEAYEIKYGSTEDSLKLVDTIWGNA